MSGLTSEPVRVLYVDDEPDFAGLLAEQLERWGGAEDRALSVETYTSPREALRWLEDGGIAEVDCVVSDYEMPAMDGLELLEAVRERWPDLPFVLYTGRGSEEIASEAISRGVTEYMQKGTDPQGYEVLANRVRNAVEKYEAERQLERTETRYRRLVEQNLTGIYIIGTDEGLIKYANPKCAAVFGYSQSELVGMNAYDVVAEEDHDRLRENVRKRVDGDREELNYTLTGVRKDGERFEFEVHSGLVDHEGEPALLGTLVDVTDQRERERELEEYRELVETIGDPMYVLDAEGHIEKANHVMAEMLGCDHAELVGAHAGEFLTKPGLQRGRELLRAFVSGEREPPGTFELEFVTADGERIPCEANVAPLIDGEGRFRGSVGVVRVIAERKKRERELEAYEAIVETAPDGVFVLDDEGRFVRSNEMSARMIGYERGELRGKRFTELLESEVIDEGTAERYREIVTELVGSESDREKAKFEATLTPRNDGDERTVELHVAPLSADDGRFRGTVGIVRDITDRKAIEEALRTEHERLSALFENIPEPTIVYEYVDGEPRVRRVNDAFEEVFGHDEGTVLGETVDEYIVPADHADEAVDLNERVMAGESLDVAIKRETADGEVGDFLLRNAPIPTEKGAEGYAIYTDITERKARERSLSALQEATQDLMGATSVDEVAEIGIESAERILGLDVAGLYTPVEGEQALEPAATTERAQELFEEIPTFRPGESLAWHAFETGEEIVTDDVRAHESAYNPETPVRSEMILPVGDHGVFMTASRETGAFDETDVSLAKMLVSNLESALDRARREALLREREQALLRQNERLEEFAGVVSHDLRSPLTVAKGNAYLLGQEYDSEYAENVEHALDRMERLIDDLLTLARQGDTVDEIQRIDLEEAIEEAWSTVETGDGTLDIALGEHRFLEADGGRLRDLLENLFANAISHGGEDVTVRVGVTADRLYVEDDGEGIDEPAGEKLFEPGFTTADDGTGFGLPIVERIANAHGWEIDITESETGGARFEFTNVEILAFPEA